MSKLKHIDLSGNDINPLSLQLGGLFLCNILKKNPVMHKLELSRNKLDDNGAFFIAKAMKDNTNLNFFGLWGNPIKEQGCSVLCKTEFDDSSFNAAADSNHTCLITNPDNCRGINDVCGHRALKAKKIFSVLSLRNRNCSNAELLGGIQVEILPILLVSIQKYSVCRLRNDSTCDNIRDDNDALALSVVYEVMRWWDKAMSVYE